jgi:putative hydrolase of the HAD superfamily
MAPPSGGPARRPAVRAWLFDLDNTLHDASSAVFGVLSPAMTDYIARELALERAEADALRTRYWQRYGATLLGLIRHHGVQPSHFLHHTHLLPGLEERLRSHAHDVAALRRLPGRKYILTNAPRAYALRVLRRLGFLDAFDGVFSIEDMRVFGHWRPKPDARMLRRICVRLHLPPRQCALVEDTLEHQKGARRIGMRTVWMQRWAHRAGLRCSARPAYVDRRVRRLAVLCR